MANIEMLQCPVCKSHQPKEEKVPKNCLCGSEWTETDWKTIQNLGEKKLEADESEEDLYPEYMLDFNSRLINDYKMPEQIARDCLASYTKQDMQTILRFLDRYSPMLTIPYKRYGCR